MMTIAKTRVHASCTCAFDIFNKAEWKKDGKQKLAGYRNRPENLEQKLEFLSRKKRGWLSNRNRPCRECRARARAVETPVVSRGYRGWSDSKNKTENI